MMQVFWCGLLMALICLQAPSLWAKERIIVLAGQSNMMGRGKTAELPAAYKMTPANVEYFSQGRQHPLAKFAYFGPEVSFAQALARAFPKDRIILVKQAASGSLIRQWQPGEALYQGLLRQVGFATKVHPEAKVEGIVWMQGESDAENTLNTAQQYGTRLETLVSHLRQDLASPDSVFVFGQVNLEHPDFKTSIETVRQQQEAAQQHLPNALMVSTDKLGKLNDGIHYNAAGQLELGKRFAQACIQRLK
jgi:lysophospholipase L1-like esterase